MSQPSILIDITERRRAAIRSFASQAHFSQARLYDHIRRNGRPTRSLANALRAADKGFILECKKASPSKGLIRESFDPVAIARIYQSYAAAISVLTEPEFFQGDFAYLQAVSQQVQVPVLCKDFIVAPLQVYLARYYGADAILLMLSILTNEEYRALAKLAAKLDLEILTEVSTAEEMQRAAQLGASIIGINHRNLHDLSIDLNRSQELAALAPEGALLVAESGIQNNQQVRDIGQYVDGFLVGSHLTAQTDIDTACRRLIYGQHKVCGLTRAVDAKAAAASGAVFGGLIFAPHSPRYVGPEQALQICEQVPELNYVAVVTSDELTETLTLTEQLPLHAVQLHGQQNMAFIAALRAALNPQIAIWYALDMSEAGAIERIGALFDHGVARILLDQGKGGSGQTFDWSRLTGLSADIRQRCMLAGGLNADNIVAAAALGCKGMDLNSGVESAPGMKDPALINQCFRALASYYRSDAARTSPPTISIKEFAS